MSVNKLDELKNLARVATQFGLKSPFPRTAPEPEVVPQDGPEDKLDPRDDKKAPRDALRVPTPPASGV